VLIVYAIGIHIDFATSGDDVVFHFVRARGIDQPEPVPAWCSLSTPMICSCVNLDRVIILLLVTARDEAMVPVLASSNALSK
jgi:hypothetical protein